MEQIVSARIIDSYFRNLKESLSVDVAIVGGGQSEFNRKSKKQTSVIKIIICLNGGFNAGEINNCYYGNNY